MQLTIEMIRQSIADTGHHILGLSAWNKWGSCHAAPLAEFGIEEQYSEPAAEGSQAHELGEYCLVNNTMPEFVPGYPEEMMDHITNYVDYVKGIQGDDGRLFVEQRIDLSHTIPECFGTADAVILKPGKLIIIDLKYGFGFVPADTGQIKGYLAGAYRQLEEKGIEITEFEAHIFQPRNGGGRSVTYTVDDILKFDDEIRIAAYKCMQPDPEFNPSEKACMWCKARNNCKALFEHSLAVVGNDFNVMPNVESLSDEKIKQILDNKELISLFLKAVESEAFSRFEHGGKIDGYKVVEGRSVRSYNKDAEPKIREILGDDGFEQKLKGITALEKILGKKQFAELGITDKPAGKKTLVPESDNRPAVGNTVEDFDKIQTQ